MPRKTLSKRQLNTIGVGVILILFTIIVLTIAGIIEHSQNPNFDALLFVSAILVGVGVEFLGLFFTLLYFTDFIEKELEQEASERQKQLEQKLDLIFAKLNTVQQTISDEIPRG